MYGKAASIDTIILQCDIIDNAHLPPNYGMKDLQDTVFVLLPNISL